MKSNRSPWIYQLREDREIKKLDADIETNVAIIGAGIAGIATAFFTLKYSDRRVVMLERSKLAHGATGHNAGQITSYFERGFASIAEEFGLEMAAEGQRSIEGAWELIDEMYTEAGLSIPLSRFIGHAGLSKLEHILFHLENNVQRKKAGLNIEEMLVAENAPFLTDIPEKYKDLYAVAPHAEVLERIETESIDYYASLSYQKGCLNSALFCEHIVEYLVREYPHRFSLYEHTSVDKIVLRKTMVTLDAYEHVVTADRVILCTNGFTGMTIINEGGLDIDTKFHHLVHGTVGYMSGYFERMNKAPTAISYFPKKEVIEGFDEDSGDPYFYLTRRVYDHNNSSAGKENLISIGGPEIRLEDAGGYGAEDDYPEEAERTIDAFVKKTYDTDPNKKIDYVFTWHGLMGYTKNGIRLIGEEPKNPVLMYNLGCNGVGILPSVYGGKRIADILGGVPVKPSIFDIPRS